MNTILWTYQRTGGTTLKKRLGCAGAIFGLEGEYANAKPVDIPDLVTSCPSFKMGVGETANWSLIPVIVRCTPDHRHIILYRENSVNRILSWYLMVTTGATSPRKMEINQANINEFLANDEIPYNALVQREITDLSNLVFALNMLKGNNRKYEVFTYENLYDPKEGYGTNDIYAQLSGYDTLKTMINNNDRIKYLKSKLI